MVPIQLHQIYNELGFTDLELSGVYDNGSFSKWKRFDELISDDKTNWDFYTERSIADIEVVLDFDEHLCPNCHKFVSKNPCIYCKNELSDKKRKELIKEIAIYRAEKLKEEGYKFRMYETGSKGFHIHLIFPELRELSPTKRKFFKENFIVHNCAERLKSTTRVMIMREGAMHRKTGKPKKLILNVEGFNKLPKYFNQNC